MTSGDRALGSGDQTITLEPMTMISGKSKLRPTSYCGKKCAKSGSLIFKFLFSTFSFYLLIRFKNTDFREEKKSFIWITILILFYMVDELEKFL